MNNLGLKEQEILTAFERGQLKQVENVAAQVKVQQEMAAARFDSLLATHNPLSINAIVAMSKSFNLFIDLTSAGLDLDSEELENYSQNLVTDLRESLAEEAQLARVEDIPEGSKAAQGGFDLGILKAEVNLENTVALLNWLKRRIAGAELEIEYGDVKLRYRTEEQLEKQLAALEKISHLTVRVVRNETNDG